MTILTIILYLLVGGQIQVPKRLEKFILRIPDRLYLIRMSISIFTFLLWPITGLVFFIIELTIHHFKRDT